MPYLVTSDVTLYYEEHGAGFPLVLTHGLGSSSALWSPQVKQLSARYRLILWDQRGHGQTSVSASRTYGLRASTYDLHALLNHLDIEKAHVGGLSMGGGVSVCYATTYPERVEKLIVCDASTALPPTLSEDHVAAQNRLIDLASVSMRQVGEFILETQSSFCLHSVNPAVRQHLLEMYASVDPDAFSKSFVSLREPAFTTENVRSLPHPILLIVGANDHVRSSVERFHNMVESSELCVLEKAGHLSNIDAPSLFTSAVLRFLAE